MTPDSEISQGKSIQELGWEAGWFAAHTMIAIAVLVVVVGVMTITHPDAEATMPKAVGTGLALLAPLLAGFVIAKLQRNDIAKYVWISGLLFFSIVCVWVLDLPTGNGLCEHCGALEKLWRTFFSIDHGSGLMGGDGLLVGTWIPFSLFGYALGAKFGLGS